MSMLDECIADVGGDPTMVIPSGDIGATISAGILKVVIDPRTTVPQCLEALLAAELIDNDCWGVLIAMMKQQGMPDEATELEEALIEEQEHLAKVRNWILDWAI